MRKKKLELFSSVAPALVTFAQESLERPDNVVESAEHALVGLPDLGEAAPRSLLRVEASIGVRRDGDGRRYVPPDAQRAPLCAAPSAH